MTHDCEYEYHLTWDTGEPYPPFGCAESAHEKWMGHWLCPLHLDKLTEENGLHKNREPRSGRFMNPPECRWQPRPLLRRLAGTGPELL